ncbi:MAG TPA: hypothetical protein VFG83_12195 [Kofleriaceae bacterium]|nr:hypothetical protein [Kofleriaceae bacterium]
MTVGLGLGFSVCAQGRLRANGPFSAPAFGLVAMFGGVIVAPTALYFYWAHPAWSWLYLVDPDDLSTLSLLPLTAIHGGSVIAAWVGGSRLIRRDRARVALYATGGVFAVAVLAALLLRGRVFSYGTYDSFAAGNTLGLWDVKLGYALVPVVVGVTLAAGFVTLELFRDARRVRSRDHR